MTATPTTLADVLVRLDRDPSLADAERKKYSGAIRTAAAILGRDPVVVPANFVSISEGLREVPAAVHGRSAKTIANMRSTLKQALLHCADAPKLPPRGTPLSPAWAALKERLGDDRRLLHGLSRLMRLASHQGLAPEALSDDSFPRLVELTQACNWGRDVLPFRRDVPRLWNEAAARVPGWPAVRLTEMTPDSRPAHLPLSAFPVSFQRDVEDHLAWAGGKDPFDPDAPAKPLKASSLNLRRNQLRIAASNLAEKVGGPAFVVDLSFLVKPENVKKVLTYFQTEGKEVRLSTFGRGLFVALQSIAKKWVKAPAEDIAELARIKRLLGPEPAGLTKKNRKMLRQFEDERVVGKLIALPDRLRKDALSRRMSLARRLQKMRIALAIDILLVAPVRLQNLASLRLDRQIQSPHGRTGTVYLVLEEAETKNQQPLEYPLAERVRDALHDYIDRYRKPEMAGDAPWLFTDHNGKAVAAETLRDGIKKAVKRELGVDITPHQFRHLAAKIALDAHPGALGMVKSLLGHKDLKTTLRSYAGLRTREAGRTYDEILMTHRADAPALR